MTSNCISLKGSKTCPAFANASISTSTDIANNFPFLSFVSSIQDFDRGLENYVHHEYVKRKYQEQLGCSDVKLTNTTSLYARYTTSVICNGIVQSSKNACKLSPEDSRPLCADTCATSATSEEIIAINPSLCGSPKQNFMDQIRSDFTVCSLPADSLTGKCILGSENEPKECGFGPNLLGLCGFCAMSSPNSTDSCCVSAKAEKRCEGIKLPTLPLTPLFPTATASSSPSPSATAGAGGLSRGAIAGIVVGSVAGAAILAALALFLCIFFRRRRNRNDNVLNQPTPMRQGESPVRYVPGSRGKGSGYEVHPSGRVARMSALQSNEDSPHSAVAPRYDSSDSEAFVSPTSGTRRKPPITGRRNGSLSSASVLDTSPKSGSAIQYSSPEGVASGQSEQLPYFRDYYSQEDIHPNDRVAVLWAYQPRAADEFELERGDMLKIVGIWDDGWATGVRIPDRAEDYDGPHNPQRDSGVSNGPDRRASSPAPPGEIKAFPLVCVCLPEHWRKTIEGDPNERTSMDI